MTIESIMAVCTSIVTFFFAELSKKYKLVQNDYIPLQNLTIGFLAGIFAFVTGISDNIIVAIALCVLSAFGAGGAYDLKKTRKGKYGDKKENIESEQDIINIEE